MRGRLADGTDAVLKVLARGGKAPCTAGDVAEALKQIGTWPGTRLIPGSLARLAQTLPLFRHLTPAARPRGAWKRGLHSFHVKVKHPKRGSTNLRFSYDRSHRVVAAVETWLLVRQRLQLPLELAWHVITFLRPAEWHARSGPPASSGAWRRSLAPAIPPPRHPLKRKRPLGAVAGFCKRQRR